jgi:hypothetical protein
MKKPTQFKQSGQALVIIAIAGIALFAFAALAIDGSMVFSDRRHAQNAADTAALDAALAKTRGGNWSAEGLDRASSNSYNNNGTTNFVYLYNPPIDGKYQGDSQYVQVKITSIVSTRFARIIGVSQITNKVEAVARSVPGTVSPLFNGNAVVGLAPHDCKAVMYQGNASTSVIGSGIFVNSDCSDAAFFNHSTAAQLTAPCLQSVGGIQAATGVLNIPSNCINTGATSYNYPPDNMVFPNVVCPTGTSQNGNTLSPGTYSGQFPPNGVTHLNGGIYCVNGDFRVNGGDTLTGDQVLIVMQNGDVSFNGGANIQLSGIPGPRTETNQLGGLFLYMPMSNCGTITINGNSESSFKGTILAPCSDVSIEGTGGSGLQGQIIGYTVDLAGTSNTTIIYNEAQNWQAPVPPKIELTQ